MVPDEKVIIEASLCGTLVPFQTCMKVSTRDKVCVNRKASKVLICVLATIGIRVRQVS